MKAVESKLLVFLKKSPQFVIPIYQRNYSWTEAECKQLWEDILRAGRDDGISGHFIGSVVYIEKGLYSISSQAPLLVIDGQQRLTTMTLLIAALAEAIDGKPEPLQDFTSKKLRNYYLLNPEEENEAYYKLILSETDKETLINILDKNPQSDPFSIRVTENYNNFTKWINAHTHELDAICKGIAKLMLVDVSLNREHDNPQLIFESMNSTGKALSQADLIRNYILMGLEHKLQTQLYKQYWRPMETEFGQEAYATHFDVFMRYFLTYKTREIPKIQNVYEAFKKYAQGFTGDVEELVKDIYIFASYYCSMALGIETDPELKQVFHDLREIRVTVAYPLLLELYHDYKSGMLSKDELLQAARLIESYTFRRAVCSIPTNSMNKTFAQFGRKLKKDRYLESIQAEFLLQPSYRRLPRDDEFQRQIQIRDLYNMKNRSYWLRRLENYGRKERVSVDEYTIEHIMPQNPELSTEWKTSLGDNWEQVQSMLLHTLGNLTLTGYNSEYSDHPFLTKRDMEGGFSQSPLRVNQFPFELDDKQYTLGTIEHWDEKTINSRAKALSEHVLGVWPIPELDDEILTVYRRTESDSTYTIEDHEYLQSGSLRALFDAFSKEVLALDPCIYKEYLKLYVAFKAETNFVDVVPQSKRLRLSLNLSFPDIEDPRKICRDVTNLGRWGNGDIEVSLDSMEDLPYVIGLVRQSFERQMGILVDE